MRGTLKGERWLVFGEEEGRVSVLGGARPPRRGRESLQDAGSHCGQNGINPKGLTRKVIAGARLGWGGEEGMFLGSKSPKPVYSMPSSWVPKAGTHGPG